MQNDRFTKTDKLTTNHRPNALDIWKQLEEHLVPRLRLSVTDRTVYAYLLSHSRLEGRSRLRFSILGLARQVQVSGKPLRESVRRLADCGALRLIERSRTGHLVEVRLPEEIRAARLPRRAGSGRAGSNGTGSLEEMDFMRTLKLRQAIHARERGLCFYCLRKIRARLHCIDHVVPSAHRPAYGRQAPGPGRNSYRNLVSCCMECNASKGERSAGDFLRSLYREGRLTPAELRARLSALDLLTCGKLVPLFPA